MNNSNSRIHNGQGDMPTFTR